MEAECRLFPVIKRQGPQKGFLYPGAPQDPARFQALCYEERERERIPNCLPAFHILHNLSPGCLCNRPLLLPSCTLSSKHAQGPPGPVVHSPHRHMPQIFIPDALFASSAFSFSPLQPHLSKSSSFWCWNLSLCLLVLNWISETEFWVKKKRIALLLCQANRGTVGSCPKMLCVPTQGSLVMSFMATVQGWGRW